MILSTPRQLGVRGLVSTYTVKRVHAPSPPIPWISTGLECVRFLPSSLSKIVFRLTH